MEENLNISRGTQAIKTQPQTEQSTQQAVARTYDFPVQIISLPSEGKCYAPSNPLSKGTLEIKYMTAKEEDILSSQNLIRKGVVLDKLFESVVVQPDVNPDDIVIGDKNAVFLATRILGYGPDYEVEVTDPFSGEKQKVVIDLSAVQTKDIVDNVLNTENRYELELPLSKKKVVFKLLTHKDEKDINAEIASLERLAKNKEFSSDVSTRLKYMIVSVDGDSDRSVVSKFSKNMLAKDTKAFREYIKTISPDLDLKYNFVSDMTGEEEALDIPFGISFFYPSN
jgi:phosphoenolpyruvate synthase/pyruvate phosphate dikinase